MSKSQEKKHKNKKQDALGTEAGSGEAVAPDADAVVTPEANEAPASQEGQAEPETREAGPSNNGDEIQVSRKAYDALTAKAEDRDTVFEKLQRSVAAFENYQKRVKRDKAQSEERKLRMFVVDLLPALDDLARIRDALDASLPVEEIRKVMTLFSDKVSGILGTWKIEKIAAQGEDFDPNFHDALRQEPTDAVASGKVLYEVSSGYTLKGAVLKAAQVIVACGQPSVDGDEPAQEAAAPEEDSNSSEAHPTEAPEA